MSSSADPSTLLSRLCGAVHRWTIEGYPVQTWLIGAERSIALDPPRPVRAQDMRPDELRLASAAGLASVHPDVIPNQRRFTDVLRAVALLDEWHEPLEGGGLHAPPPSLAHLDAALRLDGGGGYNEDDAAGLVVPSRCVDVAGPPVPARRRCPTPSCTPPPFFPDAWRRATRTGRG